MKRLLILFLVFAIAACSQNTKKNVAVNTKDKKAKTSSSENQIFSKDDIYSQYKGVILLIKDKINNKDSKINLLFNTPSKLPSSDLILTITEYYPDFVMNGTEFYTRSLEDKNAAAKMIIEGGDKYEGWLFEKYPDIHAYEHDQFTITLIGSIKK